MINAERSPEKTHYICQTYVEKEAGRDGQGGLKIAKQLEYSTASEAQNRAEREALSEDCAGATAYMVSEDPNRTNWTKRAYLGVLKNNSGTLGLATVRCAGTNW